MSPKLLNVSPLAEGFFVSSTVRLPLGCNVNVRGTVQPEKSSVVVAAIPSGMRVPKLL